MPLQYDLPWNQSPRYWLALWVEQGSLSKPFMAALQAAPAFEKKGKYLIFPMVRQWKDEWQTLYRVIRMHGPATGLQLALIGTDTKPDEAMILANRHPASFIDRLAQSLWLGEALLQDRLHCYFQPVYDASGRLFGHETFARISQEDGTLLDALTIFQASKQLGAEELLDQHLQVQAVKTLAASGLTGKLFINLVPSILHKPEKYLLALQRTLEQFNISPERIVLDIGCSRLGLSHIKMKTLQHYCAEHGFATALDDIDSLAAACENLRFVTPHYLKLDIRLVQQIEQPHKYQEIAEIVRIAHAARIEVLAEGVENDFHYEQLKTLQVDLFQGYLFGHPQAIESLQTPERAPQRR